ncbi:MAG: aconitase X [Anaerolineales bacterium]
MNGASKHPKIQFLITASCAVAALAERAGLLDPIRDFGGRITLDTCILATPMLPEDMRSLMTNSAKYAYYSPGLLNVSVAYGGLLVLPNSRGSSTTTAVLLEALRAGAAPAAITTTAEDAFFALAGIVAEEMYGSGIPILAADNTAFERIETGQGIEIDADGTVRLDE